MNPQATFVGFIALVVAATALGAQNALRVPPRFQGIWLQNLKSCAEPGEGYFRLSEREVIGYESKGPIKALVVRGNELALIAEMSGEGETWLSVDLFELSQDGKTLVDKQSYPPITRFRCP